MFKKLCASIDRPPRIDDFIKISLLFLYATVATADPLPSFNLDMRATTVSGISSGGYMALQFAVAHSDSVTGVGVFAGGQYRCAADGINEALGPCMQGRPDPLAAVAETEAAANLGHIAPTTNLSRQRAWLFSGYNDGVVKQPVMHSLYDYLTRYIPAEHVYFQDTLPAGHAIVTEQHGANCSLTDDPFVNDCDYDGPGLLLQHLLGKLTPPTTGTLSGRILTFDQSLYTRIETSRIGMAEKGYLYVPDSCAQGEACRVHIAFHGCRQYAGAVGDSFYRNAGYNPWADSNGIIMLYPQTQASTLVPFNPKGCWDWWGYTGSDFAYRNGAQISAVRNMLEQLSKGFRPGTERSAEGLPQLQAIDSTDRSVSLVWTSSPNASGFHLYRATGSSEEFRRITRSPETGHSYVDRGLTAATSYRYRLGMVTASGETLVPGTTSITTLSPPPACDPYFNDNVTHVNKGRAYVFFGLTFARGSWDYMGLWNLLSETALYREDGKFQVGVCTPPPVR
ncbi:MAG: hypothetical protein H6965_13595 [Chromatiaceae bacterium]|nr:hypothetical protein [Chromatiaceae bacterium]